jgi:hypothetical protein
VAVLLRELRERQIKILVNGVVRDLGSIDERFMVGIQSLVDRAESERIKERMHRGKRERARQGKKNSGPSPYGYQNPLKGMPGYGTLEIVEEEARVVRLIFNERLEGSGEKAIANLLNERGVPSPRGGQWGGSTIRRVLQNPVCIGVQRQQRLGQREGEEVVPAGPEERARDRGRERPPGDHRPGDVGRGARDAQAAPGGRAEDADGPALHQRAAGRWR